ncbi:MAG TPA: mercuric transporter MerT family protein [Calidithermus sp.]|nr:mercuric transporter MerT family protein [Calidithermus sp.]
MAVAGLVGALAASSCCLAPFALFALGVSGAWIGRLTALAPYQPIVVAVTLAALAVGFVPVYRRPPAEACGPGSPCEAPGPRRAARVALWIATVLVAAALVAPWVIALILAG